MGEYVRVTRECAADTMHPTLATAIQDHIARYELGDVTADALLWCETTSTKKRRGLLGGKPEVILTGVLLTSQWLIWATGKENERPGVLSAKLRDIKVQDYENTGMYQMIQDCGLNITGLRTGTAGQGTAFIGLGPEPVAQRLRDLIKQAVANAQA